MNAGFSVIVQTFLLQPIRKLDGKPLQLLKSENYGVKLNFIQPETYIFDYRGFVLGFVDRFSLFN